MHKWIRRVVVRYAKIARTTVGTTEGDVAAGLRSERLTAAAIEQRFVTSERSDALVDAIKKATRRSARTDEVRKILSE